MPMHKIETRGKSIIRRPSSLSSLNEESRTHIMGLENRTTDSQREMDYLGALQDIRIRDARNDRVGNTVDVMYAWLIEILGESNDLATV